MNPTFIFGLTIDVLIVGVFAFAWARGGAAERWGGTINLIASLASAIAHLAMPPGPRDVVLLFADGFLALGLLLLGVRYASLWIGAAMLLQAVQFLLHTYFFVLELPHNPLFSLVNNLVSMGILVCIVGGTILSMGRRTAAGRIETSGGRA